MRLLRHPAKCEAPRNDILPMDETYRTKAIVLNRRPFNEDDTLVIIYSLDKGKLELVARGTRKIKSKLAGHLEPFCLAEIMVVRGRQYDYIGAAASENCYFNIKNNLAKIAAASQAINIFNRIIKPKQAEAEVFKLVKDFLDTLNRCLPVMVDQKLLANFFIFKLLIKLGHQPELYHCVKCRNKILPQGNKFDLAAGGLICQKCLTKFRSKNQLTISQNTIKILRLAEKSNFRELLKVKIDKKDEKEIKDIVGSFLNYHFF